jgi:hypothetical protein
MNKIHDLKTVIIDGCEFQYFYTREKNDVNGNPRYKVYIIDPDGPAVHEKIFKCYENQIPDRVTAYIEFTIGVAIPF